MIKLFKKPTKALIAACQMPPLKHKTREPFDIQHSEAVKWLVAQPDILNACFGYYKDRAAIVFDKETGTWRGRDYQNNNLHPDHQNDS